MAVGSESWLQEITAALPARKRTIDTVQTFYDAEKEYMPMQIEELEISYSLKGTKKEQAYLTRS
jgi:hypothetical protein